MNTDKRLAFVQDIIKHPKDDTPRMIFADWLTDNEEEDYGEFIRVQCELAKMRSEWSEANDFTAHRRVLAAHMEPLCRRERELLTKKVRSIPDGDRNCAEGWSGGTCEAHWGIKTFKTLQRLWLLYRNSNDVQRMTWLFHRGFVEEITCDWAVFATHAEALRALTPLSMVKLRTLPELEFRRSTAADQMVICLRGRSTPHDFPEGDSREARMTNLLAAEFGKDIEFELLPFRLS